MNGLVLYHVDELPTELPTPNEGSLLYMPYLGRSSYVAPKPDGTWYILTYDRDYYISLGDWLDGVSSLGYKDLRGAKKEIANMIEESNMEPYQAMELYML